MSKIIFNAQLLNTRRRIKSLSGRLGDFIFRTYQDGRITAYYKPRPPKRKNEAPSSQYRADFDAISKQLREITDQLALNILSINYLEQ